MFSVGLCACAFSWEKLKKEIDEVKAKEEAEKAQRLAKEKHEQDMKSLDFFGHHKEKSIGSTK